MRQRKRAGVVGKIRPTILNDHLGHLKLLHCRRWLILVHLRCYRLRSYRLRGYRIVDAIVIESVLVIRYERPTHVFFIFFFIYLAPGVSRDHYLYNHMAARPDC